ncbi:DUF1015 domain-containing protein [Ferruginibacter sp. HRS2-29]|uniref:DUF1015 domain-containing protein n=1 Tax=Ferruginibacter sp. HRS2-29 TaxID=2487334 RepID=UPI0020CCF4C3|nr:DUF1015 family protein [Ferruginibacter sp. HRS2-29]MCP9750402.1 DUF1015 domain-containing protein [Ferruginibacter sp. HRS2-29]
MITITPFKALRPEAQHAKTVASRPYDVLNSKEAKVEAQGNPNSFLHITKSEIDLPETTDIHSQEVYDKAKENLGAFISRNILFRESKPCYYIYKLTMNGVSQAGLVCGSSVDDYDNGLIKKHEFTRPEKELDRITHIKTTGAQTGNVFLAYKSVPEIDAVINKWISEKNCQYDFVADDGVQHSIWIVNDDDTISLITGLFKTLVPASYIADGHHRAASAAKVRVSMGDQSTENSDYFLTTLFPSDQLHIMDYNRVVKDTNGLSAEELMKKIGTAFTVEKVSEAFRPESAHTFGLYFEKQWYKLTAKKGSFDEKDPIGVLDVSILQDQLLDPVLGIKDQRTDKRIDFVGGIRGLGELEKRVDSGEMTLAISLYPVSIQQLFDVADSGEVMPPKSTWFEPKLRDGLLTHLID